MYTQKNWIISFSSFEFFYERLISAANLYSLSRDTLRASGSRKTECYFNGDSLDEEENCSLNKIETIVN